MDYITTVNQAIRNRRSIFVNMFSGEQVDDAIIKQMLENANWAPTHKLTEPWRFTVFKGDGLRSFANKWADCYRTYSFSKGEFEEEQYEKFRTKPHKCSHIIAIGMKRNKVVPEFEEVCAVACAVENMLITASAYKIGAYWSTGGHHFYKEFQTFFDLNEDDQLLGFLFIGVPKSDTWPLGKRKPAENKVKWVSR